MSIKIGIDIDSKKDVRLTQTSRSNGVFLIGPTSGSGKLSLGVLPLIRQDIDNNSGVICLSDNRNLCSAILGISAEASRDYVYVNLSDGGNETFNVYKLLGEEFYISNLVENYIIEAYKVYLEKKLGRNDSVLELLEISTGVINMFLKILKEVKGKEITVRDLVALSKNDSKLVDLVFMKYEKDLTTQQQLLVKTFKSWHSSIYCSNESNLYENMRYFRLILDDLIDIIYTNNITLADFDLLKVINKKSVVVIELLSESRESAAFVNHLVCSTIASIARSKGSEMTNLYLYNCIKYISNNFIDIFNDSSFSEVHNNVGVHIVEETFTPEAQGEVLAGLLKDNSNIIVFPGCLNSDEVMFYDIISRFSKEEINPIGNVRLAKFKTVSAKIVEDNSHSLRKIELNFAD